MPVFTTFLSAGVHLCVEIKLGKKHVACLAANASVGLLGSGLQLGHVLLKLGCDGVEKLLAVICGRNGTCNGACINPGTAAEEVDHHIVCEAAESGSLGHTGLYFGFVEECGTVGEHLAHKLTTHFGDEKFTGESGIYPLVVAAPLVLVQRLVAGVVPRLGDKALVGHDFVQVEVGTGESTGTAAGSRDDVVAVKVTVEAGQIAVPFSDCGKLQLDVGVVGIEVEVTHAGSGNSHQGHTAGNDIFAKFHIVSII